MEFLELLWGCWLRCLLCGMGHVMTACIVGMTTIHVQLPCRVATMGVSLWDVFALKSRVSSSVVPLTMISDAPLVVCLCAAMAEEVCWNMMAVHQLADLLLQGIEKVGIHPSSCPISLQFCNHSIQEC